MKIGLNSAMYMRYPLEKAFEIASYQGYDGIEIWGNRPHGWLPDLTDKRCDEILQLKEKYNLETPMMGTCVLDAPYSLAVAKPRIRDLTIEYLKKVLDAAKKMEVPNIMVTCDHYGYYNNRQESYKNIDYIFNHVLEHAEKVGTTIVLEGLTIQESNTVVFLDDILEVLDRNPSPRLVSMIDIAMMMTNYELYDEYVQRLGNKMQYVHIGDNTGTTETHQEFGQGIIEFEEFLRILRRSGYDDWMTIEIISSRIRDPELFSGKELRYVRKALAATDDVAVVK